MITNKHMSHIDMKDLIVRNFKFLSEHYRQTEPFKSRAYSKAIQMLPNEVYIQADVETIGGKSIQEKISTILTTNDDLPIYKELILAKKNVSKEQQSIHELSTIHGIGVVKATELVRIHSITSVEDLKLHKQLLNDVQKKGLHYHSEIRKRIPRKEMEKHNEYLRNTLGVDFVIAGSFRRNNATSGDIDVLITGDANTLRSVVNHLCQLRYIQRDGIFAIGEVKCMAMCRLPRHQTARRIDILYSPKNEFAFAQLYFTGNDAFNIQMRAFATTKGYVLNEKGMFDKNTGQQVAYEFHNERAIFDYLDYQYTEPSLRNL